ncbi:MAG: hypothetical protein ACI81T_004522 [Bacteroidia bacterium]|jgi:hypothetical protein
MTGFEKLVGFEEITSEYVRNNILIDGVNLISKQNGKSYQFGELEIPTLAELREKAPSVEEFNHSIQVSEIVGDVQKFHSEQENQQALFQAASQFNLLEMVGPNVSPERGVGIYELTIRKVRLVPLLAELELFSGITSHPQMGKLDNPAITKLIVWN